MQKFAYRPAIMLLMLIGVFITSCAGDKDPESASRFQEAEVDSSHVKQLDPETGLIAEGEYLLVRGSCTGCHSANLIMQNRMTRDNWLKSIRWMQETQGLWEFPPELEEKILDYLGTHYAPDQPKSIRRQPLKAVNWHVEGP